MGTIRHFWRSSEGWCGGINLNGREAYATIKGSDASFLHEPKGEAKWHLNQGGLQPEWVDYGNDDAWSGGVASRLARRLEVAEAALSADRSEVRREALEELIIAAAQRGREAKSTSERFHWNECIRWIRALMEKDAPVRPTSDALDPAGLEAVTKLLKNTLYGPASSIAEIIITAYLKAAKEVR